jgi:hypothetical protein
MRAADSLAAHPPFIPDPNPVLAYRRCFIESVRAGVQAIRSCRVGCLIIVLGLPFLATPCPLLAEEAGDATAEQAATAEETAAPAGATAATTQEIDAWITELGHDAYTVRQAAATRLLNAGMSARHSLLAVVEGPDPEVRAAARRLLSLIEQSEFHRRLEAFAADVDGRRGLKLPGWDAYRTLVGGDAEARALFVEMQRHEGALLSAVFGPRAEDSEHAWEDRLLRLVQWPAAIGDHAAAPPLGSCAAMLFLGTSAQTTISDRGAEWLEYLIQRPPIRESLAAAKTDDALRRLITSWILHCPNQSERILLRRLTLASAIDLKESLPLALDVASRDPKYATVPPVTRAIAVLLVGQLGSREHVDQLEPLLEDASVCMPVQAQVPGQAAPNVQVRDVALVVMIQLTGQRPMDYGYLQARLQPQRTFQLQTLFRENDAQRAEAVAKWRAWRVSSEGADAR